MQMLRYRTDLVLELVGLVTNGILACLGTGAGGGVGVLGNIYDGSVRITNA